MGGQQLPINLSGVIVAAMLILAAVLNQPPLQSQRPQQVDISPEPSGPYERIPARTWADPFEAVKPAAESATAAKPEAGRCAEKRLAPPSPGAASVAERCGPADNVLRDYLDYLARDASNETTRTDSRARLVILPVMISGAPHGAAHEQRLRWRAAVHAALFQRDFKPTRPDRLGLWLWRPRPDIEIPVPFEAFKNDAGSRRYVLVLWLNDQAIARDYGREAGGGLGSQRKGPLAMLDRLLLDLGYPALLRGSRATYPGYRSSAVRALGPGSSDSLQAVYAEVEGSGGRCEPWVYRHLDNSAGPSLKQASDRQTELDSTGPWTDRPQNFSLISPFATAPDADLVGGGIQRGDAPIMPGRGIANARPCARIGIYRTVLTDEKAIAALVDELVLRGVDPSLAQGGFAGVFSGGLARIAGLGADNPKAAVRDHVVLISEWDTKFGRTLPKLFEAHVAQRRCEAAGLEGRELGECAKRAPENLHMFYYMRGLDGDGRDGGRSGSAEGRVIRGGKIDLASLATGQTEFQEPASGTNQFDYLRRLTQQVADLNWSLRRSNQGSIRAFGILGNDYFDKLLILQALKERFPSHLYFTTELDAGFLDTRVFRRTRNLIIAAPFGLSAQSISGAAPWAASAGAAPAASPSGRPLFPPFRHSLQTSLYVSVLAALDGSEAGLAEAADAGRPLLFEIGQDRFFPLKRPEPQALAPNPPGGVSLLGGAIGAAAAAVPANAADGVGFGALQVEPWRTGVSELFRYRAPLLLLTMLIVLLLGLLMLPRLRRVMPRLFSRSAVRGAPWLLVALVVLYLAAGAWMLVLIYDKTEPFTLFSGISVWPSEMIRLFSGLVACLLLYFGWRRVRAADIRIGARFGIACPDDARGGDAYRDWYPGPRPEPESESESMAALACRLFRQAPEGFAGRTRQVLDGAEEWCRYLRQASLSARLRRVVPAAVAFWLLAFLVLYGLADPVTPHRGARSFWFSVYNGWLFAGAPFAVLLLAALDEAFLCTGLLRRLENRRIRWPLNTFAAGCQLDHRFRTAIDYWLTTELIAARTAPAAQVIHLPFIVILFLLLSVSSRFDNWNTPASALVLILVAVGTAVAASLWLRATAQRIRRCLLDDLKEAVTGVRLRESDAPSDRLRTLVERIEKIHEGAYTQWYKEPVFRALLWVLAIAILIVTEYATVGG